MSKSPEEQRKLKNSRQVQNLESIASYIAVAMHLLVGGAF